MLLDERRPSIREKLDRRQNRLAPALCPVCGRANLVVKLRTEYVLHLRCEHCRTMCSVPKPGYRQAG